VDDLLSTSSQHQATSNSLVVYCVTYLGLCLPPRCPSTATIPGCSPNGMMQHPGGGMYHIFYQWNPSSPRWAAPWWGHVVSADLVKWQMVPPALQPDAWCGCCCVVSDALPVTQPADPQAACQFATLLTMACCALWCTPVLSLILVGC
jgi:hypothetical protein